MAAVARSRAAATFLAWRVGTTMSATTSVRLWVLPPARKNRRRTRPTTSTSSSTSRADAEAGASNQTTGTLSALAPSRATVSSNCTRRSDDGSTRSSAGRERRASRTTTFIDARTVDTGTVDAGIWMHLSTADVARHDGPHTTQRGKCDGEVQRDGGY